MTRTAKTPAHPPLCVFLGGKTGNIVKFHSPRAGIKERRAIPTIAHQAPSVETKAGRSG